MRLLVPSRSVRVRSPQARRFAVAAAAFAAGLSLTGGCQAPPTVTPTPPPPPRQVSPQQAASLQQTLMAADPNARVGRVEKVGDQGLVAVDGLSPAEVKPGMTVTFYDAENQVVAHGSAFDAPVSDRWLIVDRIVPVPGTGRMPRAGDAVVFLGAEANR